MKLLSAFQHRVGLFVSILICCASLSAHAETLSGLLEMRASPLGGAGTEIYVSLKNQSRRLRIIPSSPSIQAELRKLKAGDYIIGQGTITETNEVYLDAIESVGLQMLLGTWRTADWEIYDFRDFNRLVLYRISQRRSRDLAFEAPREFHYVLAPENGSRFSIFLSDNNTVHAGSLEILEGRVTITVFNNETGDVAENISLSPVPAK